MEEKIVDDTKFQQGQENLTLLPNFRYFLSKYHHQGIARNNYTGQQMSTFFFAFPIKYDFSY